MSYDAILEIPNVVVVSGPAGQSFLPVDDAAELVADFGRDGDRAIIRANGDEWLKTAGAWAATGENFWGTLLAQGAAQVDQARQAAEQAQTIADEFGDLETGVTLAQAAAESAAQDAGQTAADRAQTSADRTQTGLDRAATGTDAGLTAADRIATAADRAQTTLDRAATGADASQTAADRIATGLDRTATGADAGQTAADRLATGADAAAAGLSATQAAAAVGGVIYDTTAAGIAATVNGQFFIVKGDGTTTYALMYKNVATVATLIASYPSKAMFDAIFPSTYDTFEADLSGWQTACIDVNERIFGGVKHDGSASNMLPLSVPWLGVDGNVSAGGTVAGLALEGATITVTGAGVQYVFGEPDLTGFYAAATDANGLVLSATLLDGRTVTYIAVQSPPAPAAANSQAADIGATKAVYTLENGSNIDVYAEDQTSRIVTKITAGGRNTRPTLNDAESLVFFSDESDGAIKFAPVGGGPAYRALADRRCVCWGDSLTAGLEDVSGGAGTSFIYTNNYPDKLAALLGRTVINRGKSSLSAKQVAVYQGGVITTVTASGNTIPASGAVNVTLDDDGKLSQYTNIVLTGTLAGVYGTLSRAVQAGQVSFTRAAAGASTPCPPGTTFIVDPTGGGAIGSSPTNLPLDQMTNIIWVGRNGITVPAENRASVIAMVAHLKNWKSRYLVLSVPPGSGDRNTSGANKIAYDQIIALNAGYAADHGNFYVDLIGPLQAANDGSAQDLTDVANGIVPASLRSDAIHFNNAGYTIADNTIYAKMVALGWAQ
ncbi:hypothetical protein [Mesorhizobium sp. M1142]|uniref:hypothetical protein n=1 Tax=Mesorhizobium sp. M1142 TaxID=2957060 RepID=UPI003339A6EE